MAGQSLISLATVALVIARAVNMLKQGRCGIVRRVGQASGEPDPPAAAATMLIEASTSSTAVDVADVGEDVAADRGVELFVGDALVARDRGETRAATHDYHRLADESAGHYRCREDEAMQRPHRADDRCRNGESDGKVSAPAGQRALDRLLDRVRQRHQHREVIDIELREGTRAEQSKPDEQERQHDDRLRDEDRDVACAHRLERDHGNLIAR